MTKSIVLARDKIYWRHNKIEILALLSVLAGIVHMSFRNYLLFHTIVELFSIVIGITIFIISINTYKTNKNRNLIFLGITYGFVAFFDLLHMLTYKGMGVFQGISTDIPTQLWIVTRYMESISLLMLGVLWRKRVSFKKIIPFYFMSSIILIYSISHRNIFPKSFIEGVGLTPFKIISEYIICCILLTAMIVVRKSKAAMNPTIYMYMIASIFTTMISELLFTLYTDVYGLFNMAGHILKVVSFYLVYRSIVEVGLKAPYEELHRAEERYRSLIELFPESFFIVHEEKIILANHKFSKLLGVQSSQELVGKSLKDCIRQPWHHIIDKYVSQIDQYKETKIMGEEVLNFKDKTIVKEIMITPFPYEKYDAKLIILRDITERKKAQELERSVEENKKLLKESLEYDQMRTEFYSNLSHEMRTPLNLIYSTIQILELQLKNKLIECEYTHVKKYIMILRQNFYRMLRLVNNLLDITKMDAGYFKLELTDYNIVNVIEEITLSISQYIEDKNISLVFDTEVEEKIVAIDPNAMERIMLNLLSNAIKFTDAGDEIMVSIHDQEDAILISVKDTGVGIPKDKLKDIFDRFTQVEKTLKKNKNGTGIGLSLVESLVKMHHGEISVYSEYGKGTEFIIKLPVQKNVDCETYLMENYGSEEWQSRYVEKIHIEFSDIYSVK